MFALRPYQERAIEQVREAYREGHQSVLYQLPTGGGKTVTASTIVHGAARRGNVIWWVTHRRELVAQASRAFHDMGIPHGVVQAGYMSDPSALVQVASIQTIIRRLEQLPAPALMVFDEAHHIGADSWSTLFHRYRQARKLGLTATPWRLDGQGLITWFTHMVRGPSVAELIGLGSLSRYRLFAPATPDLSGVSINAGDYARGQLAEAMGKPTIVGDAILHWKRLCPGKRAIAFTAGVENSKQLVDQFLAAGIPAEHVDGTMRTEDRDEAVARFRHGRTLLLSNDSLFGEGFDVPAVEAVIDLQPSRSLSKVLQGWGRALRPDPGKEFAFILDHAGNSAKHGLPDDHREWSLADRERKERGEPSSPVKSCTECFYVYRPQPACPQCGFAPPPPKRDIRQEEGDLQEVTAAQREVLARKKEQGRAQSLADLVRVGRARGMRNPDRWAAHVMQGRETAERFARACGLAVDQVKRFKAEGMPGKEPEAAIAWLREHQPHLVQETA